MCGCALIRCLSADRQQLPEQRRLPDGTAATPIKFRHGSTVRPGDVMLRPNRHAVRKNKPAQAGPRSRLPNSVSSLHGHWQQWMSFYKNKGWSTKTYTEFASIHERSCGSNASTSCCHLLLAITIRTACTHTTYDIMFIADVAIWTKSDEAWNNFLQRMTMVARASSKRRSVC